MATYLLLHGAGSDSWYWHRVAPQLTVRGHEVVAPDLPSDDDDAGLDDYADVAVAALGDRRHDVIVVAQSMAGFVAPLVCERAPVRLVVLVAAMVPRTGEAPGAWWANTGHAEAKRALDVAEGRDPDAEFDPVATFFHDVPAEVTADALPHGHAQSGTPFERPWPGRGGPDVPTRFVLGRQDRFFPAPFLRRVAEDRLGIIPDELDTGHLPALARPDQLVERLEAYRADAGIPPGWRAHRRRIWKRPGEPSPGCRPSLGAGADGPGGAVMRAASDPGGAEGGAGGSGRYACGNSSGDRRTTAA